MGNSMFASSLALLANAAAVETAEVARRKAAVVASVKKEVVYETETRGPATTSGSAFEALLAKAGIVVNKDARPTPPPPPSSQEKFLAIAVGLLPSAKKWSERRAVLAGHEARTAEVQARLGDLSRRMDAATEVMGDAALTAVEKLARLGGQAGLQHLAAVDEARLAGQAELRRRAGTEAELSDALLGAEKALLNRVYGETKKAEVQAGLRKRALASALAGQDAAETEARASKADPEALKAACRRAQEFGIVALIVGDEAKRPIAEKVMARWAAAEITGKLPMTEAEARAAHQRRVLEETCARQRRDAGVLPEGQVAGASGNPEGGGHGQKSAPSAAKQARETMQRNGGMYPSGKGKPSNPAAWNGKQGGKGKK